MIALKAGMPADGELILEMDGHAGGERNGQDHDLVCCAASMLCQTLAQRLQIMQVEGLMRSCKVDLTPGRSRIRAEAFPEYTAVLRNTWDTIATGFAMIEARYPQCLRTDDLQQE